MDIEICDFHNGKLYRNKTNYIQVFFYNGDSHRLGPKKSLFISNDGRESNAEGITINYDKLREERIAPSQEKIEEEITVSIPEEVQEEVIVPVPEMVIPIQEEKKDIPNHDRLREEINNKYGIDPDFFFHPDTYRLKDAFKFAAEHRNHFSVCVIREWGRGDILMASIIAKALKYHYGDKVSVWMRVTKGYEELLKFNPYVERVFTDDREMDRANPDIKFNVNDLEFRFEMHDMERLKRVSRNRTSIYLHQLDLPLENKTPVYVVGDDEDKWAKKELKKLRYDVSKPIIAVQLRGMGGQSRTWNHMPELVTELRDRKYQVLILDEKDRSGNFIYTFRQAGALMKQVFLCVTPNSFYFHQAGCMKKRCVCIFGSVDSNIWIEDYEKATAVEIKCPHGKDKCWWKLSCMPGNTMDEKENAGVPACISEVSVGMVMNEIEKHFKARKVAIVMLTYNCLEFTKRTVDSIRSFHNYEIFVVDNVSTDGTIEWLKEKGIKFISKKCSVPHAQNLGKVMALKMNPDYIMIMNNDVILDSDYIDVLVETIERRKCSAVIGNIINDEVSGISFLNVEKKPNVEGCIYTPAAGDFSALLLSLWAIRNIGADDEAFYPRYQADEDYLLRIRMAGGDIVKTLSTSFRHFVGTVIRTNPEAKAKEDEDWARNVAVFFQKWGFDLYAERHLLPHLDVIRNRRPDWKDKLYIPLPRGVK